MSYGQVNINEKLQMCLKCAQAMYFCPIKVSDPKHPVFFFCEKLLTTKSSVHADGGGGNRRIYAHSVCAYAVCVCICVCLCVSICVALS